MITPDLAPAGPSPVAIRAAGKAEASGGDADGKAEAPTLERAFAAFVEAEPLAPETSALPEALDPLVVLEGAAPPVPPTPPVATPIVAIVTPAAAPTTIAVAPEAESAEHAPVIGQRVPRAAAGSDATTPAPRPLAAPVLMAGAATAAAALPPDSDTIPLEPAAETAEAGAPAPAPRPVAAPVLMAGAPTAAAARPPDSETIPLEPAAEAAAEVGAPAPAPAAGASLAPAAEPRPVAPPPALDVALQPASGPGWRLAALNSRAAPELARNPAPAPRDVAGQITLAITQASAPQIEIRLDPPELGRVQIRLNPTEAGLTAIVLADRPETQDFLRRHADALTRELTDAGYAQVSLEFAAGGDAPPRDAAPGERRFVDAFATAAALAPAPEAPRRTAAGGLDIRL